MKPIKKKKAKGRRKKKDAATIIRRDLDPYYRETGYLATSLDKWTDG